MNKHIKQEWLKRLKSGEYTQGPSLLAFSGLHCCLGVLAEMATEAGIVKKRDIPAKPSAVDYFENEVGTATIFTDTDDEHSYSTVCLTEGMENWSGLKSDDCAVLKIINANDARCDGKYTAVIPLIEALPEE